MKRNYERGAERIISNAGKAGSMLDKVKGIFKRVPVISTMRALKRVPEMGRMVVSYARKEYTEIPKKTIYAAAAGLIYLVSPVDAYPDPLPGGYMDDIIVLERILDSISEDVDKYSDWRRYEHPRDT